MKLDQWVNRELRALPPRPAPATLQSRVMAELARRAALPWWRRNFLHWPLAVRIGFVLASAVAVRLALQLIGWMGTAFAAPMNEVRGEWTLVAALGDLARSLIAAIPLHALLAVASGMALLYGALFGLGALAYRGLYQTR